MPPEDQRKKAESLLNPDAARGVRIERRDSVQAAPADPDGEGFAFEAEVYRYAADWISRRPTTAQSAKPFAMVLSRSLSQDKKELETAGQGACQVYQAFHSQKLLNVESHIVFTTVNLERAIAVPVADVETAQDLFDAIGALSLGDRHIAVFEPSEANLILLKAGLNGVSREQQVRANVGAPVWNLVDLEKEIQTFHSDYTRTPSGVLEPWFNATDGVTGEKLEIRISKALANDLDRKLKRGSVLAEVGSSSGRMDVYICSDVLTPGCGPCVLEVKVLRSRHKRLANDGKPRKVSDKSNNDWAMKGVVQADLYRCDKGAPVAYLCAFDARDADKKMPDVEALAASRSVSYRKYFMHRSTGSLQAAELGKS
ncbi:hypothetical protein [Bradyrhizobium sp. USDA 3650]